MLSDTCRNNACESLSEYSFLRGSKSSSCVSSTSSLVLNASRVRCRSHLEYASEIWSPKSVTMIKRIEGVQRRATKLMLPNLSYNERLKRLDLLPLVYRREVKDLSTFYKLKSGNFNCSFNSYFQFCSDERLRSHASNKLKINRVRTEHFKGTFFNRIPYLWNNLPDALRTTNCSVFSFKRLCTIFYKDRVFDPDHPNVTWA